MTTDPVNELRDGWQRELADLDTAAMETIARLNRVRALAIGQVEDTLTAAGSSLADFDVLSALRRQGPPYQLKPSTIAKVIMLSASGTTHRIDQLERSGLVTRVSDPTNRRIVPVALTKSGIAEAERLVRKLAQTEETMMSTLTKDERTTLDTILAKLALGVGPTS